MRRSFSLLMCGALAAVALTAVGPPPASTAIATAPAAPATTVAPGDPLIGSGTVARPVLTAAQLASSAAPTATVPNDAFALPAAAAKPLHTFEGTLTLKGSPTPGTSRR